MSLPALELCDAIPPADDPESMVIVGAPDGSILIVRPPCVLDRRHPGLHTWQEGWAADAQRRATREQP
jgi:hypothetical protein